MTSTPIKSGSDIINDFIISLDDEGDVDAETIKVVRELVASDSLTVTRVSQGLSAVRKNHQEQNGPTNSETSNDG